MIILGALFGFFIPVIAIGANGAGLIVGILAGAPSGALGGILACVYWRYAGRK